MIRKSLFIIIYLLQVVGLMISGVGLASTHILTEITMKENGRTMSGMARERTTGQKLDQNMWGHGRKAAWRVPEN